MSGDLLRLYSPVECKANGYPFAWPEINALVVEEAGSRCLRCKHPYRKGETVKGEWSPCDEQCAHGMPARDLRNPFGSLGTNTTTGGLIREIPSRVIEARWRILTVHHLTGSWGKTHEAKRDCRWWNLLALCQRCHLTIQGRVDPERPWPWDHSEWFRPYAAGFYARKYLALDLSRAETLVRMEELLALGQRMDAVERMPI